jgi:hypothetical protein
MFPNLLNPLFSKAALWWLKPMFMAHRMAATINLNTLNQIHTLALIEEGDRQLLSAVKNSLNREILAVEAILGITSDD